MKIRGKNSGFGEINMKVKTRQQGNSVVLTVPKTLNVHQGDIIMIDAEPHAGHEMVGSHNP
ncbi:hypothetical protein LHEJCM20397_02780 [Lactobacillus helveticus]|nr:hypothetical protein LHEJCM1006_03170 [Lactobacillus helveticus]GFP16730.1 hypothetical protein LHEJCM20397_02780 [Lactobacillus helveticus]GIP67385.1 hypothetical protein LhelvAHU1049_15900 [Lactobacillus helveticus]